MADFNMGTARGRILIEYNGQGVREANEDMERTQRSSRNASDVMESAGTKMGAAGLAIAGGYALAVKSAADFDKVMSGIKAVTGATTPEMDKLREKALQLGADTKFSAGEAATAMEELSKAGITIPDILNGAADATVALAAAGEVALPEAAELSANALNQFGLKAQELPKVADLIAGAANASAISVGEFGESMKQVGAVAHLAGVSFQDTSVAIALLGNAGIKGGDAGTSLKTMFSTLIPKSKEAKETMQDLGIITKDGANQFFDATGKVKSLAEVSEILKNATKNLSSEQKLAALNTIFGSDAIRGAAVLADQGAEGFNKMSASMDKIKAADVAKVRMDNLSGAIENMKGSFETAMIKLGSGGQGPIRSLVEGVTGLINAFNNMSDGSRQMVVAVTLGVGAFLLLGSAIIKTVFFFQRLAEAMRLIAGTRAVQTVLLNLRSAAFFARLAIQNLVTSMIAMARSAAASAAAGIRSAITGLQNLARQALLAGRALLTSAVNAARSAATSLATMAVNAARAAAQLAITAARATALAAANLVATARASAVALAQMAASAVRAGVATATMAARTIAANAAMVAIKVATAAWTAAQWLLNTALAANPIGLIVVAIVALVAAFVLAWKHSETFRNIVTGAFNAIKNIIMGAVNFVLDFLRNNWRLIITILGGPIGAAVALITKYWDQIKNFITGAVNAVLNFLRNNWRLIITILGGPLGLAVALITKYWDQIKSGVTAAVNFVINLVKGVWNKLVDILGGPMEKGVRIIKEAWDNIRDGVSSKIASIINLVLGFTRKIINLFSGAGSWLAGAGRAIIQGLLDGINSAIGRVRDLLNSVTSWIPDWKGPMTKDKKLLTPTGDAIMGGLMRGIEKTLPALRSMLGSISGEIVTSAAVSVPTTATLSSDIARFTASSPTETTSAAGDESNFVFNTTINNPVAEPASDSVNRRLSKVAQLGLLNAGVPA